MAGEWRRHVHMGLEEKRRSAVLLSLEGKHSLGKRHLAMLVVVPVCLPEGKHLPTVSLQPQWMCLPAVRVHS